MVNINRSKAVSFVCDHYSAYFTLIFCIIIFLPWLQLKLISVLLLLICSVLKSSWLSVLSMP